MGEFLAADREKEKTIQSNTVRGCFKRDCGGKCVIWVIYS